MNITTGKRPFQIVYGYHPRGIFELKEIKKHEEVSRHADDFSQSMVEVHEQVKRTLGEANQKLKKKWIKGGDMHFEIGDWVLVHLNKDILPKRFSHKAPNEQDRAL